MIKPLLLFAALALSAPALGADLDQARALVDQKNYIAAIPVYDALLAQHPGQVDLLIEAGRVNAWADRHADAARLYRRAIDAAPRRRHDVLLALAWQLAWDAHQAEAIPLFEEVAQQVPSQRIEAQHGLAESLAATGRAQEALAVYRALAAAGNDLKARKGEAQMLLWLDRDDEAAACYRAILQAQPADKEAQIGLARALNYAGRHFAAVSAYAAATRDANDLARNTRVERATALRWAGLEDQASVTLGDAEGKGVGELRAKLRQETASQVIVGYESSRDSDALDIQAWRLGAAQRLAGATLLDVATRRAGLAQNGSRVDGNQVMIGAGTRVGDVEHGLVWPAFSVGVRDYGGWQTAAWKLQAKWLPVDRWRVDLEAGNDIIENIPSIKNRVRLSGLSASADWRFAPNWTATAGSALVRFDDGNQRTRLIGRFEHVVKTAQPRIAVGLEAMGFNDSDPAIARGYYNPERYREIKMLARAEQEAAGWLLQARLALGNLWETPGSSSGLYAWELSAARDLAPMLRVQLLAGGSDSSMFQRTGGGYTRNYLGASLIWFY